MAESDLEPVFCPAVADLAGGYDGFIIDQWGVLHDGGSAYPGAIEALQALRAAGKRIVLLSNSGKRAAFNQTRLVAMGFDAGLYDAVITSGEAAWQLLRERADPAVRGFGRRCFIWSRGGDLDHVAGLDVELVADVADADFIYLAGVEDHAPLADFLPGLETGAKLGLPLICANPDLVAIYPRGERGMAPGAVARHYESLGGRALYVGKPHRPVYERCLAALALPSAAILAIGDSLEHDIAGGRGMGADTALIAAGVHRDEMADLPLGSPAQRDALTQLVAAYGVAPRWVLPRFIW
jgi:HAD superfamily hydrolase (TIGR01459 family)